MVIPRQPALETIIEYTHRFSSGLALVLVAGMLYLAFRTFPSGHRVRKAAIWAGILIILEALLGAGLVVFELVGGNNSVTRAVVGAALGDTLFPPVSVADGFRQDLAPGSHFLLRLRGLHPFVAVAISFILIGLARVQGAGGGSITRISSLLFGLTIIQLIAGTLNLFLLASVWLQILHLLLADTLWISLVLFADRSLRGETVLQAQDPEREEGLRIAVE